MCTHVHLSLFYELTSWEQGLRKCKSLPANVMEIFLDVLVTDQQLTGATTNPPLGSE